MRRYRKLYELTLLIEQAMLTEHFGRAEKLLRQALEEAFKTEDNKIIGNISYTFMTCRRIRVIKALEILKRIDPIQSQRRELS